jgi:hypothetical protein
MHFPHPRVGSMAGAPLAEVALSTAVAGITAAEDIMARALDSVSAFTRLTDMRLRFAVPPDSMMQMACGDTIRVAPCRTDIKLAGPDLGRRSDPHLGAARGGTHFGSGTPGTRRPPLQYAFQLPHIPLPNEQCNDRSSIRQHTSRHRVTTSTRDAVNLPRLFAAHQISCYVDRRLGGRFVSVVAASNRAAIVVKPGVGPSHFSWSTLSNSAMSVRSVASVRNSIA